MGEVEAVERFTEPFWGDVGVDVADGGAIPAGVDGVHDGESAADTEGEAEKEADGGRPKEAHEGRAYRERGTGGLAEVGGLHL